MRPAKPKISTIWLFTGEVCQPLVKTVTDACCGAQAGMAGEMTQDQGVPPKLHCHKQPSQQFCLFNVTEVFKVSCNPRSLGST